MNKSFPKALIDLLYLSNTRSRAFAALPELDLEGNFDRREARRWLAKIPDVRRRAMVDARLAELLP